MKIYYDKVLLIMIIILSLFGLLMVYSASNVVAYSEYGDSLYYFKKQGIFLGISFILLYLLIKFDVRKIKKFSFIIFCICLLLLILVLVPGIGVVRGGARSWINVFGITIQPSEFMKVGIICLLSKYLSDNYRDIKKFSIFILLLGLIVGIFLVIMLQPDFGTGLVILFSSLILLFVSGARIKFFIFIIIGGICGLGFLIISAPYRLERITAFLDPWSDPLGSGFQGIQSLFAITPGGFLGHGFNKSIQKHFFLPEPQNDFIFAIVLEEFGMVGGFIVLLMYGIIIFRGIKISIEVNDRFLKFLCLGLSISLFVQVFINTGVVVGLLPVTGITLPLFSYGGSSLLITIVSLGIIVSSSKYTNI